MAPMIRIHDIPIPILLRIRDYVFLPDAYLIHERCDSEKYQGSGLELLRSPRSEWLDMVLSRDWRSFVNANKKDFIEIKRETVYYDLNDKFSSKLLGMKSNLEGILGVFPAAGDDIPKTELERVKRLPVMNKNQQISFGLAFSIRSLPSIFMVNPVETFKQEEEEMIPPFPFERLSLIIHKVGNGDKTTLNIAAEELTISLKYFPFIKYLTIWNKDGYDTNLNRLLKILVDPSMQLHSFNTNFRCEFISDQNTTLFQHLTRDRMPLVGGLPQNMVGSLQKVDLSYSKALMDVFSLRHVHSLSLKGCEKVEDVSMLGEVYSLNISHCPRIVSIASLGKVKKLSILGLKGLRDGLPRDNEVKELWADAVTYDQAGVSEFQDHDKRIHLSMKGRWVTQRHYTHIPFTRVSVYYLDLRDNCNLAGMRELVLDSCKLPSMFTPMKFPQLRRLLLLRCEGVQGIVFDHLPGLKVLKIDGCGQLKNLTIEHDMDVLELFQKAEVEIVTIRGVVNRLVIRGCVSLKLLDVLGEVRESDITGLKDCRISFHKL